MTISITSSVFTEGGMIPIDYTGDGMDISPPLEWSGIPEGTQSLALIVDDPDAPAGNWVHWVFYNIPATTNRLSKSMPTAKAFKNGAKQGVNDFQNLGYGGPCPPCGTHRYYFKLYALDTVLTQEPGLNKAGLLEAMQGHILDEGQLMGRYTR